MSGLNKVQIIGHLGADPDQRYMPNGKAVTNIRIATSETWKDKQSGDRKEKTEWHSVVAFEKLAEIMGEYLRKGSKVYVEGKLQTRKWQDKEGKDRYTTEIIADRMQMLGSRQGSGDAGAREKMGESKEPVTAGEAKGGKKPGGKFDDLDDDIPF